jgi:small subunit ribosomal protein S6
LAETDYELILMLDPQIGDEQRQKLAADAKGRLEAAGTVNHESTWGLRKMAYEIEQRSEADYRYYRFRGDKVLLDDLDHALKIADGVLRFRIFKVDPEAPVMVPPDTEQIMRRDDDDRGRGRGRGRREDRAPERPAPRAAPPPAAEAPAEPAAAEAPAEPAAAEQPAAEAPAEQPAAETPAEPAADEAPEEQVAEESAPSEPAPEPAPES